MGEWRMHIASKAIDVASGNGIVFAALETGLLEYDIEANETSVWNDVNSLSDINVSCIYFDEYSQSFFLAYKNGNIDRIKDNLVTNIPAIKLAEMQGDKNVYSFSSKGNLVYACTGFGIVVINSDNNEIKDSYYPTNSNEKVQSIAFVQDSIFALSPSKLYKSSLSNSALADPNQWKVDVRVPIQTTNYYQDLQSKANELYLVKKNSAYGFDSVFHITNSGLVQKAEFGFSLEILDFKIYESKSLLTCYDGVVILDNDIAYSGSNSLFDNHYIYPQNSILLDGDIYEADNVYGLIKFSIHGNKQISSIGPPKNNFFALGGNRETIGVAGGIIHKTGVAGSSAGAYLFKDEEWKLFDKFNQNAWTNREVFDVSSISINPLNENEIAFGTFSPTPISISYDASTISEVYDPNNAPFVGDIDDKVCVSDIKYDSKGNLWVLNGFSLNPLKVLTKDKVWKEFSCGSSVSNKFSGKISIDKNDNKWFAVLDEGLIGYNDGGTIDDVSDDKYIQLNTGENTGALPSKNVSAIAVDLDNEIWIGTPEGFAILYNSESAFDGVAGEYNAQRIKIDFEGNVEYLLGETSITDIEVDGGNRKWIATANAGIFLLSPDGLEIIESFTKENSPLISNNIVDLQFNTKTGELFIITDIGLVSYRTNSSEGDSKYEDVIVFPNPVKPEFNGVITIQGIKYDSDVKFTDIAGNLVFQTTSNGGTATWNGKNLKGEKVTAGTYLIWTASNTEKGRKVGKVVILN
ncbi:MAG: hypothetical protein V4622_13175 [Bacteroidota bacterium]